LEGGGRGKIEECRERWKREGRGME